MEHVVWEEKLPIVTFNFMWDKNKTGCLFFFKRHDLILRTLNSWYTLMIVFELHKNYKLLEGHTPKLKAFLAGQYIFYQETLFSIDY